METVEAEFAGRAGQSFGIRLKRGGFGGDKLGTVLVGGMTGYIVKWSDTDIRGVVDRDAQPGVWVVTTNDGRRFSGPFQG